MKEDRIWRLEYHHRSLISTDFKGAIKVVILYEFNQQLYSSDVNIQVTVFRLEFEG